MKSKKFPVSSNGVNYLVKIEYGNDFIRESKLWVTLYLKENILFLKYNSEVFTATYGKNKYEYYDIILAVNKTIEQYENWLIEKNNELELEKLEEEIKISKIKKFEEWDGKL